MPLTSDGASERTLNAPDTRDTVGLYMALGVSQDSTQPEIKRAYRRLALQYHPDRNPGASGSEFVRIQYAYDVLSDERKRRIYDRYGDIGIQMAGRMGGELLDPKVSNLLSVFAFVSALVSVLLISFFALLAKRVDHAVEWSYKVVFAPLWVVDMMLVAGVVASIVLRRQYLGANESGADDETRFRASVSDDADDGYENDDNDYDLCGDGYQGCCTSAAPDRSRDNIDEGRLSEGSTRNSGSARTSYSIPGSQGTLDTAETPRPAPATDTTPLLSSSAADGTGSSDNTRGCSGSQQRSGRRSRGHRLPRRGYLRTLRRIAESQLESLAKAAPAIYIALLIAFQISLVLRLDNNVQWSIWRVALPWLCIEGIHFVLLTLGLVATVLQTSERHGRPLPTKRVAGLAMCTYWWLAIRLAQAIMIIYKLSNPNTHMSWFIVFVPVYFPFVWTAATLYLLPHQLRGMGDAEILQNERAIVIACVVVFAIVSSFVYSFVALLVWKLTLPSAVRLALVLIPVFIFLSVVCCCCSCMSFCLAYGMHATLDDEQAADSADAQRVRVPAHRRINVAQRPQ
ncbi:hypothetical protein GGI15_000068 [Coemansia interrupta]|uniref:J domain-containing protein n=1 Tax=Coemansia interrupta TaxID=1126814 RepID=A0A9W8HRT8_9FUNG|nr:hypothetical protein GGI15_000068 [Coemansia interrupta]